MTEIFICEKILTTSASSGKKLLPNYTVYTNGDTLLHVSAV
jgi:hypothetical protein